LCTTTDSCSGKIAGGERRPSSGSGVLVINADDWGYDAETTDRILECIRHGVVSSTSAMAFMADSERGAALAQENGVDAGLHLNLTTPFSAPGVPDRLLDHQRRIAQFLRRNRFAQALFHPGLAGSFRYVVTAQLDEFQRLFGMRPARIDGHHHMHLASNVLFGGLLPAGTTVRRSFSFQPGEKSFANRLYRHFIDRRLARRHCVTDLFFSLPPLEPPDRLQRIAALSRDAVIELETHPVRPDEYRFLMNGEIFRLASDLQIAHGYAVPA
jgi:predicted glycoside hydrolase/deacetylase ChbG (UPF0249 family)